MTDFDGLSLVDYLPLPIFDATTLTTFDATVSAASPAPGTMKHGPADTFFGSHGSLAVAHHVGDLQQLHDHIRRLR